MRVGIINMPINTLTRDIFFCGQEKLLGKKVSFFSKEGDLVEWIRENPHRRQISQQRAKEIFGDYYNIEYKKRLDKDIVEPDPEYKALLDSRKGTYRKSPQNFYWDKL